MKKTLWILLTAILAVSCQKGGGGNDDSAPATVAYPYSVASGYCAQNTPYQPYQSYPNSGSYIPAGQTIPGGPYQGGGVSFSFGYNVGAGWNSNMSNMTACSEAITVDFCNTVLTNCGWFGNGTQLYSNACRVRFQEFQSRTPGVSCYYNRYGVYGTLTDSYLQYNINTLSSMGL